MHFRTEENEEMVVLDEVTIKSRMYNIRNQKLCLILILLKHMDVLQKDLMNK